MCLKMTCREADADNDARSAQYRHAYCAEIGHHDAKGRRRERKAGTVFLLRFGAIIA